MPPRPLSSKRAELEANAVLAGARAKRERDAERSSRWLVWLYPELRRLPPSLRRRAFKRARFQSYHPRRTLRLWWLGLEGAVLVGYLACVHFDAMFGARVAWWLFVVSALGWFVHRQWLLRRWIRGCDPRTLMDESSLS